MIKKIKGKYCLRLKNYSMRANIRQDGNMYAISCEDVDKIGKIYEIVKKDVENGTDELRYVLALLKEVIADD